MFFLGIVIGCLSFPVIGTGMKDVNFAILQFSETDSLGQTLRHAFKRSEVADQMIS